MLHGRSGYVEAFGEMVNSVTQVMLMMGFVCFANDGMLCVRVCPLAGGKSRWRRTLDALLKNESAEKGEISISRCANIWLIMYSCLK